MFKNLFAKKDKTEEPVLIGPAVMGLANGSSFTIDALEIKMLSDQLNFELPESDIIIAYVSQIQLDHNSMLYRFHANDNMFLQVITEGGNKEEHIQDIKLYNIYESFIVDDVDEWNDAIENNIVLEEFQLGEQTYSPVWDASNPVEMAEKVFMPDGTMFERTNYCMLYEREVQTDFFEFAFIIGEESDNGDLRTAKMIAGVNLQLAEINIIG